MPFDRQDSNIGHVLSLCKFGTTTMRQCQEQAAGKKKGLEFDSRTQQKGICAGGDGGPERFWLPQAANPDKQANPKSRTTARTAAYSLYGSDGLGYAEAVSFGNTTCGRAARDLTYFFKVVLVPKKTTCVRCRATGNLTVASFVQPTDLPCPGSNEPHPTSPEEDRTNSNAVLAKRYRYRNSDCAVSKLPPELLCHVFSINVLCDRPCTKNGAFSLGWMSIAQVCHWWREVGQVASVTLHPKLIRIISQVALATPSFWKYLDFAHMSRKWCSEMLRRSGNCPLEVALRVTGRLDSYPVTTSMDIARELVRQEYSARLTGLHLHLSSLARSDVEWLIHSLQRSAPLLESLDLRQMSWESMTIGSLASCLPSFKRLALYNVFLFPWVSPIFLNLHELHIDFDRHRLLHLQDTLPSYDEMAIILGRMPELRSLALRNVFAEGSHADVEGWGSISFPKLQTLSLIDQQESDLLSFVSLLRLPSTTCAEIKTNGQGRKGVPNPVPLFSHYEGTFGPVRRLKLFANGSHPRVTVEFRVSDAISVEPTASSQLRLDCALPLPRTASLGAAAEAHLGLNLESLLYLEIVSHAPVGVGVGAASPSTRPSSSSPHDHCWWVRLLHASARVATHLQQVRATYRGAVDALIEVLSLTQPPGEQQQRQQHRPHPAFFPNLRTVKLALVDLDEIAAVPPPHHTRTWTRGDVLLDALAKRRELGFGIWELEVSDRDGQWVRKFREIVPVPSVTHAGI
ncbi:hypothetical protein BC827DRAFT_1154409 [Russula dissimulans]|nr:hypothetical protein BC827DRAFT_1154409 [Russula dissimulans]